MWWRRWGWGAVAPGVVDGASEVGAGASAGEVEVGVVVNGGVIVGVSAFAGEGALVVSRFAVGVGVEGLVLWGKGPEGRRRGRRLGCRLCRRVFRSVDMG